MSIVSVQAFKCDKCGQHEPWNDGAFPMAWSRMQVTIGAPMVQEAAAKAVAEGHAVLHFCELCTRDLVFEVLDDTAPCQNVDEVGRVLRSWYNRAIVARAQEKIPIAKDMTDMLPNRSIPNRSRPDSKTCGCSSPGCPVCHA